ncbi:MAG: magnesium and cobalt transport protein CorA, partial [Flavobacteriaceae bacterium]|nr:magnesium and cobalt transport protein CorA [Flavobacteriaceae bacterium]
MTKTAAKISKKAGMPPGTLVHIGKKKSETTKLTVMDYDAMTLTETIFPNPEDCFQFKNTETVSWINIDGLHNTDFIASIGDHYELHHLLVEDILNTRHRPKVEEFENYIFLTLKMLGISKNGDSIIS